MVNGKEELSIVYGGKTVEVTPYNRGTDTFFLVDIGKNEIELKLEYIEDNPVWTEDGMVTQRAEELGRLIEEADGR